MQVRAFNEQDAADWDTFCDVSTNATLLHKRRYLSYHGDRFADCSLILIDDKDRWIGLLPACVDPDDPTCVVSHAGVTYGGFVHTGRLFGGRMIEGLGAVVAQYRAQGFERLRYKAVPWIYQTSPAQDDLYALFRLGASRVRCDLSATINLAHRRKRSERRRRALRKAERAGATIHAGSDYIPQLWNVLRANLARKHGAQPVHSEAEIELLAQRFPEEIQVVTGWISDDIVAGVVVFVAGPTHHAQYIASSEAGDRINALDAVFEACITRAKRAGAQWWDFGISNERAGTYLNDGLHTFKVEFGGGGTVHEFYELDLEEVPVDP